MKKLCLALCILLSAALLGSSTYGLGTAYAVSKEQTAQTAPEGSAEPQEKEMEDKTVKRDKARADVHRREQVRTLCVNHQKTLENKLKAFTGSADKSYERLTEIFDKVLVLKEKNSMHVEDYETLLPGVVANQAKAKEAIADLHAVANDIDCSHPETSVQLSQAKEAAARARDALKTYKSSLKTLIGAIHNTLEKNMGTH